MLPFYHIESRQVNSGPNKLFPAFIVYAPGLKGESNILLGPLPNLFLEGYWQYIYKVLNQFTDIYVSSMYVLYKLHYFGYHERALKGRKLLRLNA